MTQPRHGLSELLRRRHAHLMRHLAKNPNHDEFIACTEEAMSIEYWLRITEEAERSTRMTGMAEAITHRLSEVA